LDTDRDGVSDLYDQCPDAKETNNKFQDEDGCPDVSPAEKSKGMADADDDGITDRKDNCPSQPETYNKFLDGDGCPDKISSQIDTDRDGLKDSLDDCPTYAETYNKFLDGDGCPDRIASISKASLLVDTDNDGIPDWKDRCLTDAEVFNQFKDGDGCPDESIPPREYVQGTRDADKDGFLDDEDLCPASPETWNKYKDNDGCPDVYPKEGLFNDNTYHVDEKTKVTLTGEGTDPNPEDVLSFTWVQTEGESIKLSDNTAKNPFFMAPEVGNGQTKVLVFELRVDDGHGGKATDSVRITVDPVNNFPTADAGDDNAVDPSSSVRLSGSGNDPDGDRLSYSWKQINGMPVVLSSATSSTPGFTAPDKGTQPLTFELTVSDGYGGKATDTTNVIVGKSSFSLLKANAGPDQTVDEGTQVDLDGSESSAPNGEELTFSWEQTFGEQVMLDGDDTLTPSFTAPDVANGEAKVLIFKLTISAKTLGSATDLVAVRVVTGNGDPTADAGPDQTVYKRTMVKLAGSGDDPDGDKLRYSWKQIDGEPVKLSSKMTLAPTFIAPKVANGESKTLEFTFTVSDKYGGSDSDSVVITVMPVNSRPTANAGGYKVVDEQTKVKLAGSGKDPNKDPLSFSWAQTGGEPVELSSTTVSNPSFIAPVVNNGEIKSLTFKLTVDDGNGGQASASVKVIVNPVNESPTADAGSDQTVTENTVARLAGSGDDADGDALTFKWSQTDGPVVTLSSTTEQYPTFTAPEVDKETTLSFELTANDGMAESKPATVTVTVKNTHVGDLVVDAGRDQVVDENVTVTLHGDGNDPSGTLVTFSWVQTEGDTVTLSSSTVASPTFTSPEVSNDETKTIVFELTGTDGSGRVKTDTVTITVDPINADPTAKAGVKNS
ncbi:MAG: PKD domain-containing protein, partial [Nitrososphaerales archaeon]